MELTKRWMLIILALLMIGGIGAGALYAIRRGRLKKDLYGRALQAIADERQAEAATLLRTVLEAQPGHLQAFLKLQGLLWDERKYDAYFALCDKWAEGDTLPKLGWRNSVSGLIRLGRLEEAEVKARSVAERDPILYHEIVLWKCNISVDPRVRLAGVRAARNIADLTEREYQRADVYLTGASILLDIAYDVVEQRMRDGYRKLAASMLDHAIDAVTRGKASDPELDWLGLGARINLWRGDAAETRSAVQLLEERLDTATGPEIAVRAELVSYYLGAGQLDLALDRMQRLVEVRNEIPTPRRIQLVRRLARSGSADVALALMDRLFEQPWSVPVDLLSLEVLFKLEKDGTKRGAEATRTMIRRHDASPPVVRAILSILVATGQRALVPEILEFARKLKPDSRLDLLLTGVLASQEERPLDRIGDLAQHMGESGFTLAESGTVALMLDRIDPAILGRYLDARIESGGEGITEHLLLRARLSGTRFLRARDGDDRDTLRKSAIQDLHAVANSAELSEPLIQTAARLAYALDSYELAGSLIARETENHGEMGTLLVVLARTAMATGVPLKKRKSLARGLSATAADSANGDSLRAVAQWLVRDHPSWDDLAVRAEELSSGENPSVSAHFLAATAAAQLGRPEDTIRHARSIVGLVPDSVGARLLLAGILVRHGDPAAAEAFLSRQEKPTAPEFAMRGAALMALKSFDSALEVGRRYLDQHSDDPRASMLVARALYAKSEPEAALGVLTAAPATRTVALARAEVFRGLGRGGDALEIYGALLSRDPSDRLALDGRHAILITKGDTVEAIRLLDRYVELFRKNSIENNPLQIHCLSLRGQALEGQGKLREALRDYEQANAGGSGSVVSYNNGAWILAERANRLAKSGTRDDAAMQRATDWAAKALVIAPRNPSVWDTAAHVEFVVGRYETALTRIEKAITLENEQKRSDARDPEYRVRRALILEALDRLPEAIEQLQEVEREFATTPTAARARLLRDRFTSGD